MTNGMNTNGVNTNGMKHPGTGERAAAKTPAPVQVDIYVVQGCFSCQYSHEVAAGIRQTYPDVQVRLIDIAEPDVIIPDAVFATPTYLLNGQLWSLGNPSPQDVRERLSTALGAQISA